jgi:hypothetical protein
LNRGDNRLVPSARQIAGHQAKVRVTTLDRVLGGRKVDFVKMDVQGWEGAVLKGMQELLRQGHRPWIHLEICPHLLEAAGSSLGEIDEFLREHGCCLRQADTRQGTFDLQKAAELRGALGFTNALAVPCAPGFSGAAGRAAART